VTDATLIEQLIAKPREELAYLAGEDAALLPALVRTFPDSASHVGYSLFDPSWIRAYGRHILRAIGHARDVHSWNSAEQAAIKVAILAIADDLIKYLGLPKASTLAVVALVILIVRGLAAPPHTEQ
jgi:hypothetical protein